MQEMRFVIILSQANESSAEAICRPCEVIIRKPSGFKVKRIFGKGDLWITEYTTYPVSIMEFRDGKVVHERILSRHLLRGADGFSGSSDAALRGV